MAVYSPLPMPESWIFAPFLMLSELATPLSELWPKLAIFLTAMVKFSIAALVAMANPRYSFFDVLWTAGGGALLGTYIFTYFGAQIKAWVGRKFPRRRRMSFRNRRRIYRIWYRYGLLGVAMLSPLISPMISIGVAYSFQEKPRRILLYVGGFIVFWSLIFASFREFILSLVA